MQDRLLPDWITAFLEFTERREPPTLFKYGAAISTIAACLRRKCSVRWGYLEFFPNLYIILVGPPGCKKGTAMAPCRDFLLHIGVQLSAEAISKEALIRSIKGSVQDDQPDDGPPIRHCSLTVWSQDFAVFTGYQDRERVKWMCDWFDGTNPWTYETKNRGVDKVYGLCVNIIGATTHEDILEALPRSAIGGGLTRRVIFIAEEEREKVDTFPFLSEREKQLDEMLRNDLQAINMMCGTFKVDQSFLEMWGGWYEGSQKDLKNPHLMHRYFQGYRSTRATHVMKLCMIMSASRSGEKVIRAVDLKRSIEFLEATERNAHKVFLGFGRSGLAEVTGKIMTYIATQGRVSGRDLLITFYNDVERVELAQIVDKLETMGFCRVERRPGAMEIVYIDRKDEGPPRLSIDDVKASS